MVFECSDIVRENESWQELSKPKSTWSVYSFLLAVPVLMILVRVYE